MSGSAPFCIELEPASKVKELLQDPQVFAVVRFTGHSSVDAENPGLIQIAMPPANGEEFMEVWRTSHTLRAGHHGMIHYLYCDEFLFGSLYIADQDFDDIADATAHAYQQIHDTLEEAGYPALLRMWNYFPRINEENHGLERYRSYQTAGGWNSIPAGDALKPGLPDPRVATLRKRLAVTADLPADGAETNDTAVFDPQLEAAVKVFQTRHGLDVDGIVGPDTLNAMNVPVSERIEQIRVNLERQRWIMHEAYDEFLIVDIAGWFTGGATPAIRSPVTCSIASASAGQCGAPIPAWVKTIPASTARGSSSRKQTCIGCGPSGPWRGAATPVSCAMAR